MNKNNLMSIIVGLILLAGGIFIALMDAFSWKTPSNIVLNIGCSMFASAIVILLTTLLVDKKKSSPLDEWSINKIYCTRAEKNADSDPNLDKAKYQVDAVAFGLSNFRSIHTQKVETCLRNNVNFRILTMNPESDFIRYREIEEDVAEGQIKKSINDLVEWANKLNKESNSGKIIIKGYDCMTLDFYWRVDDEVYIGPYWFGRQSIQTITYAFSSGGKGFSQYTNYFEDLWKNEANTHVLTEESEVKVIRRKRKK